MRTIKRIVVVASVGLLLFGFASMGLGQAFFVKDTVKTTEGPKWAPGEILVKFHPGTSGAVIDAVNGRHGTAVVSTSRFAGFKRLRIPPGKTVPEMVEIYKRNPNVEYAEPNFIASTMMTFNDPGYYLQWHMDNPVYGGIHMEDAWDVAPRGGSPDVIVAVIDTGVAYEDYQEFVDNPGRGQDYWITYQRAPDLAQTTFVSGYDFVNDDAHPNDDEGHGTHVTGTIAQSTNNGEGVAGIAYNTAIMPIKVLDRNGSGTYGNIADGIYFAAEHGASVINMSLGGSSGSITLETALSYAYGKGVTIVCASGNDGSADTVSYPAAYDAYCIAVGATRYDEAVSYYSNGGSSLDVTAPGGDINVDQNGDGYGDGVLQQTFDGDPTNFGYWFYQGTSMATPHVSGVAALLIAQGVATTPDAVREALQATAEDHGAAGWDTQYGWGIIDAYAALTYNATPNTPPVANAGGPYSGTEDQAVTFYGSASFDPDGDPLTYRWDFGDGSTDAGVTPTHTYSAGGTYTVTLIVNDGKVDSLPATANVDITEVNDPPVADAGPDRTAVVGDSITFDGSASYDDGAVTSYDWNFGDGATGSGATTTHTYSAPGTYTVTLTVTDNGGLTGTDTAEVTVTETQDLTMHVAGIAMSIKKAGLNVEAIATVTVWDEGGAPVGGVTVSGHWSGLTMDIDSGMTTEYGTVSLHSDKVKNASGTYTFTVDNITKDGWTYDPDANEETSGSITVP